nr:ABC transporter permease [uncultured Draconibacterium sp.]
MISNNIKQSFRSLKHNKLYSFLNIGGFAVGFAVCMVLALYTFKENSVDKDFANHSNLYRLIDTERNSCHLDYDIAQILPAQFPDIKLAVPFNYISFADEKANVYMKKLDGEDFIQSKAMISTTNDFFKAFSLPIIAGDSDAPFADLNSVVLTKSIAQKLFGTTDVIGEIIDFAGMFSIPISAVCEDIPANSSIDADIFYNSENENFRFSQNCNDNVCCNPFDIYVELNDNVNTEQFAEIVNEDFPANKMFTKNIRLQPLADIYLESGIDANKNRAGSKAMINIFLSIAILIMLLSVINYVNLSISKQLTTLKDIAIKVTNGAGAKQLRAYYLVDVSISVLIAFVLAIGISALVLPFAEQLLGTTLNLTWLSSPLLITGFAAILISTILISSFAPVYIVSRFDVQRLFGKKQSSLGKQFGKKALTTFQLSTAMMLLIGLIVIQKQIHFVKDKDLGFDKEQLVRIDYSRGAQNIDAMKQRIDQLAFVKNSSLSHGAPGSIYNKMSTDTKGQNNFVADCIFADDQFLETFDIHLLEGREFQKSDLNNACLINETAYKKYGWDNLENRKFNNGKEGGYNVVGVVRDFNVASLHTGITPVCILYNPQFDCINVKLAQGSVGDQIQQLKNIWGDFFPDEPMRFSFYDAYFDAFYHKEEREGKAIAVFSIIAFMITCLGLIGQIFQTTNARIKEIGVRKVNGATISEVMSMLNKDFVRWVVIAFVIATPVAYLAMNKWLENFAYKTTLSWWIFALAGLLALGIALLTVSWQSWRAATRNPVEALRYE